MALSVTAATLALTSGADCGKYSPERYSQECQERADVAAGIFFTVAIAALVVGWMWWRHKMKRVDAASPSAEDPDGSDRTS